MHRTPCLLSALVLSLATAACSDSGPTGLSQGTGGGDGDRSGDGDSSGDGDIGGSGDGDGDSTGDGDDDFFDPSACGDTIVKAQPIPPDILIVQDRSSSMVGWSLSFELIDRWDPSVSALKSTTQALEEDIRFGLLLFPDKGGDGCTAPSTPNVEMKLKSSAAIASALDANIPTGPIPLGYTPTGAALTQALKVFEARGSGLEGSLAPGYVLLVTDGEPTCGASEAMTDPTAVNAANMAIEALEKADIKTFVVGYDVTTAADVMNGFAERGGTEKYIGVTSGQELEDALRKISGATTPCTFTLLGEPQDPSAVSVNIDGMAVEADPENGWSVEGKVVKLNGASCSGVQDGKVHPVDISVPCAALL